MADGLASMAYAILRLATAAMRRLRTVRAGTMMALATAMAALFVLAAARAAADEPVGNWFVLELRGAAFSRPSEAEGTPWQSLQPGTTISPGTTVRTGGDGHLLLANRVDRIRLSPNSELALPKSERGDGVTRVIHWIGRAFFDVGKRPSPQFEVNTPYLVAVVKGTAFTTAVSEAGSTIKVTEGVVGVASAQGGAAVDVAAGETASVSARDSGTVSPGDLTAPDQGGGVEDAPLAPAAAADATVEGETIAGAGGSTARRGDGRGQGGGNGNGGDRGGGRDVAPVGGSGRVPGGGQDEGGEDDDNDYDDDDDDGGGYGCHGGGGCHDGWRRSR
jgi:hypothetical protein